MNAELLAGGEEVFHIDGPIPSMRLFFAAPRNGQGFSSLQDPFSGATGRSHAQRHSRRTVLTHF
jgi:hypothetical protein